MLLYDLGLDNISSLKLLLMSHQVVPPTRIIVSSKVVLYYSLYHMQVVGHGHKLPLSNHSYFEVF